MDYRRAWLIKTWMESLTDEERKFLVGQDDTRFRRDVMTKLDDIKNQGSFKRDFASNIAGNTVFDGAVFLAAKLLKLIR